MITLQELKEKSNNIFGLDEEKVNSLVVPAPQVIWKDRLAAYKEAGLDYQYNSCFFDQRCEQAKTLGFAEILIEDAVQLLMGDKHDKTENGTDRCNYEYFYNYTNDKELRGLEQNWGGLPTIYVKNENPSWRCKFGKLPYLRIAIPYGVILKINELKKLKLFNAYSVLAPEIAFTELRRDIDPIVVGTIFQIEITKEKKEEAARTSHFFIAQW